MAVERDTRGLPLADEQRFNCYPATPFPSISWIFEGELHLAADRPAVAQGRLGRPLLRVVFAGPHRRPVASWSPGAVHALTVSFYPEALGRVLDIPLERCLDVILPLEAVMSGAALTCLLNIERGPEPFSRVQSIVSTWPSGRPVEPSGVDVRAWLFMICARAALSPDGEGARQVQRRIKGWTGQSRRDLQLYERVEAAALHGLAGERETPPDLAAAAIDAGFSDQSHLGREVLRMKALSSPRWRCAAARGARILVRRQMRLRAVPKLAL
ncbi:MAG TPA: hypothetical protein PLT84_05610 [Brevundimonas diminuta]|nr:hypothetical protein [Brevundimonas diminuta]